MTGEEDLPRTAESVHSRRRLDDARAMRALAHPSRMTLWELLTVHGPMTATQAAEHVDDSPSNCSFHLRQLARYGLVEEADDIVAAGRCRPWRVVHVGYTVTQEPDAEAASQFAAETLTRAVLNRAVERQQHWQRHQCGAPEPWRKVGCVSQTVWWITAAEAADLKREVDALVHRFRERLIDRTDRPDGAQPIEFVALMHPFNGDRESGRSTPGPGSGTEWSPGDRVLSESGLI